MSERIKEIEAAIKEQIQHYQPHLEMQEVGTVLLTGDGIATVYGLMGCMAGELLEFEDGSVGLALNLEERTVAVALLSNHSTVREGSRVKRTGRVLSVPVGEALLGRVGNALGEPIDGKGPIHTDQRLPVEQEAPGIIQRKSVSTPLQTGIKAIDSMIPIGRGQRELIIGDRQTGKTEIALDAILNQRNTGVISIYVSIGQKSSSVVRLVERLRNADALENCVVLSASASESAPLQYVAPYAGCAMAEYFRRQGKDVLIVYDDLSKHAVAYRALSLLIRRPPGREAYPGDVFYLHSRLLERAVCMRDDLGGGSITALPIVETQGGDVSSYIPTNVISITDGQIFLESDLFHAGIMPAINPGISVSRVGGAAQLKAMKAVSGKLKLLYAQYRELQAFARFGSDLDEDSRRRLDLGERITEVLKQPAHAPVRAGCQVAVIYAVTNGYLDHVPVEALPQAEQRLYAYLERHKRDLLEGIEADRYGEKEVKNALRRVLEEWREQDREQ